MHGDKQGKFDANSPSNNTASFLDQVRERKDERDQSKCTRASDIAYAASAKKLEQHFKPTKRA